MECQPEIPGGTIIEGQPDFIGTVGVKEHQPVGFAEPRQQHDGQGIGDPVAVGRGPRGLHASGGSRFGRNASSEQCQQFAVIGVLDRIDASSPNPQRLPFPPASVGSPLSLRGLQHQLPGSSALGQVDLVDDIPFGFLGGDLSLQHLVQFTESSLPGPPSATAATEKLGEVLVALGQVLQQWRLPVASCKRGHVIGGGAAGQQPVSIDDEDRGPDVSAVGLAVVSTRAAAQQLQSVVGVQ